MSRKLLITIIVIGVVLVIVGAIIRTAFITLGIGVALIGVWIYLALIVWKKKTQIFHEQLELRIAVKRLKTLKSFLLVAVILLAIGVIGTILHNVLYGINQIEEPVSFIIGILGLFGFVIATIGSLVIFLKGRRRLAERNTEKIKNSED